MENKVSVIVPVYNVEKYLKKCLDSLVAQTLEDIEIIVVNDGSPDDCQDIIDAYSRNYPDRIVSIKQENQGLGPARNTGIKKAKGDYIGFCDSDDWAEYDMFGLLYDKAKEDDSDIVICDIYVADETKDCSRSIAGIIDGDIEENDAISMHLLQCTNPPSVCNQLYRRELWDIIDFPNIHFEDLATSPIIASYCKKYRFCQNRSIITGLTVPTQ